MMYCKLYEDGYDLENAVPLELGGSRLLENEREYGVICTDEGEYLGSVLITKDAIYFYEWRAGQYGLCRVLNYLKKHSGISHYIQEVMLMCSYCEITERGIFMEWGKKE